MTQWYRNLKEVERAKADAFLNALEANVSDKLAALQVPVRLQWQMIAVDDEAQFESVPLF